MVSHLIKDHKELTKTMHSNEYNIEKLNVTLLRNGQSITVGG